MPGEDASCPKCGAPSEYVEPETVHNGLGQVPVEPDSWWCPEHGRWTDAKIEDEPGCPSCGAPLPFGDQRCDACVAESASTREELRAVFMPLREAHDGHEELDPTCPFCTGAIT